MARGVRRRAGGASVETTGGERRVGVTELWTNSQVIRERLGPVNAGKRERTAVNGTRESQAEGRREG
jgi:hypothetical protein